ncbi:DGQHR domain-containing protein [Clostridium sartagoforme]|uniref:DGQHR domain-containing protein n=1 Tax=Clostridium sartagoforme TaxID=84031 RepID=A0A4S2DSA3_9CLOT|nr:DGQHR domain-containing protein [Clostridium sartagoforme]TGY44104.1 DGQHR domain-containing protein [Clostridium sartagoforme]
MTSWDKIVTGKDLESTKNMRKKTYITSKQRKSALPELVQEGWHFLKEYKDTRFISVRKDKPYDEVFEDKIWLLFANMGFTHMNKDRHFKMQYDYQNSDITQQIDIFAADDETVLIVECKASYELKDGNFKKPIEAFYAQINGLRKEALKKFPGRKVKFIWATNNYIMSKADLNKLQEWDIIHFNDSIINYYIELVKHLGTCARFQLLGNLFANQEIRNMDNLIPAIEGKMGGHKYYSFSIEPEKLLKIGYVLHRNEANKNMMPTYQRLIKKKRLQDVQGFINNGGYFPNSLIISIDTKGKGIQFDSIPKQYKIESTISRLGTLHLPKKYRSAYIIDGQHRLYGYSDSDYANKNSIPVVAFVDLKREEQIKLFMDINENQKSVPKSLRVTLNADMLWVSDNYNERRQALRSKIAQMLGEEDTSPLLGRIQIGENEKSNIKCITIEAVQAALKKCSFFTLFNNKNMIISDGTFDLGENQTTCDIFYPFIEACFAYIKDNLETEWDKGEDGILTINRGIQGIIRVINDIVNHLKNQNINLKQCNKEDLLNKVIYYLDPLIQFIDEISDDERNELKGFLGGGADNKYWRTFQKAISDTRKDFNPEGLEEYWRDKAKIFNSEAIVILKESTLYIKDIIRTQLNNYYGNNWLINGVPKNIYKKAKTEADDQNYEYQKNGDYGQEVSIWDCININDCSIIVCNYGKNWSEIFEKIFVRPKDINLSGGKTTKIEWMKRLGTLQNNIKKSTYSVSQDEYNFIKDTHEWLKNINI